MGDIIQITNAIDAGVPFAIIAVSAVYSSDAPGTVLVVVKDGPIRTAKDFNGRTIGVVTLRSLPEITTREWLLRNGADPATVKFVEVPAAVMEASVLRGTVAGAMAAEPHLSRFKATMRFFGKPFDTCAKTFALTSFYARRDWLTANADSARRFVRTIYETAQWANQHHDASAAIIAKYSQIDLDIVRAATRTRYATAFRPQLLQPVIDIATKYHAVAHPVAVSDLVLQL